MISSSRNGILESLWRVRQKTVQKKQILCSVTFFPENRAVYEIVWKKYCRAGQATDVNGACVFKFYYNLTTITGTLHADRHTFLIISR